MHYEYKIFTAVSPISAEQLSDLSDEGWELLAIIEWKDVFYFYFKRLVD